MSEQQEFPELLSDQALADFLGMSRRTVRKLDAGGKIPRGLKLGGMRRWRRKEIEAWLAADMPGRRVWEEQHKP